VAVYGSVDKRCVPSKLFEHLGAFQSKNT
jgi:hypothetical protein